MKVKTGYKVFKNKDELGEVKINCLTSLTYFANKIEYSEVDRVYKTILQGPIAVFTNLYDAGHFQETSGWFNCSVIKKVKYRPSKQRGSYFYHHKNKEGTWIKENAECDLLGKDFADWIKII